MAEKGNAKPRTLKVKTMHKERADFLKKHSIDGFLPLTTHKTAMRVFNASFREIERDALELKIVSLRYKRNQSTINVESQKKLFNAHVAIIGCGGLGGNVAEMLTRIGVGKLTLFDFDLFEEHNLNRQNFSNIENIGKEKVYVVKDALEKINSSIEITAFLKRFHPAMDFHLISGADVVVDALDSPQTKLQLAKACKESNIGFVYGAIAGMNGQFTTNNTLENVYQKGGPGAEVSVGNPSFSVSFAASIQAAEVVKLILNIGNTLENELLFTDLMSNEFILLPIKH